MFDLVARAGLGICLDGESRELEIVEVEVDEKSIDNGESEEYIKARN